MNNYKLNPCISFQHKHIDCAILAKPQPTLGLSIAALTAMCSKKWIPAFAGITCAGLQLTPPMRFRWNGSIYGN